MKRVFIDGSAGTTGLRIRERLSERKDLELVILPDEIRKDPNARRDALNSSDVAFLCLPDAAAVEAAAMVENPDVVLIDTSTAHRCNPDWLYGFPEIHPLAENGEARDDGTGESWRRARRIANPGCHASGFVALVAPLVAKGLVAPDAALSAFSLTGYSGGGKKMIAEYTEVEKSGGGGEIGRPPMSTSTSSLHLLFQGGRQYALGQTHKHLPEMVKYCGLKNAPVFSPVVVPHLSGMEVTVQLHGGNLAAVRECYRECYGAVGERRPGVVRFAEDASAGGFISSAALSGRDDMIVSAYGNDERIVLVSLFDNLGKGASGAAIQNMNLALGCGETTGLKIKD